MPRWRLWPQLRQRWRMVNFLTVKTAVPRPEVLALPPARAPAHPNHDPMLTHPSAPCAQVGSPCCCKQCNRRRALVAGASRELRTCGCRRNAAASDAAGGQERPWSAMCAMVVDAPRGGHMPGHGFVDPLQRQCVLLCACLLVS